MAINADRYKRFEKTFIEWLRANSNLVTFTGHTAGAPKIYMRSGPDEVDAPSKGIVIDVVYSPVVLDVDDGIYEAGLNIHAFHKNRLTCMDMVGTIEKMLSRTGNTDIVLPTSDNITSVGMRPTGVFRSPTADEDDVFVGSLGAIVRWKDTQA